MWAGAEFPCFEVPPNVVLRNIELLEFCINEASAEVSIDRDRVNGPSSEVGNGDGAGVIGVDSSP